MRLFLLAFLLASPLAAATYNVGPGQPLSTIGAVPWATLGPGDIVRIHYRATPYAEKWVLCRQGASGNPITIQGVPEAGTGNLPVITGASATTAAGLNYWGENRGVLKIGGANTPADLMPQWIVVENLEFRSAHPSYTFTDDTGASGIAYAGNASGIYVEKVKHLIVRNCTFTDCGNGFFVAPGSVGGTGNPNLTEDVYVGYCYIHGNGINASAFEHNSYCECNGIVYEYNRYGPLRTGANGNALKDRSANCVVRYNWIESGNRQLDLVEADGSGIETLTGYNTTYVYGNVLIEPNGAGNSQILHYGGDNGNTATYRKGTLYFYGNTIVSTRTGNTTLMRLSTNSETCDCRNNIIYVSAAGSFLGLIDDTGVLNYRNNWLKTGYINSHSGGAMQGTVTNQGGNVVGTSPGFLNEGGQDFSLAAGSACINAGTTLAAAVLPTHNVTRHYVKHQQGVARPVDATFDIGAFEVGTVPTMPPSAASGLVATANMTLGAALSWSDNSSDESGFRIERQIGAGAFATLTTVGANVTSYNDSGLTLGTMYTYRIVAYNAAGDAAPSNTSAITAQGTSGGGGSGGSSSGGGGGGGCAASESAAGALVLLALALGARRRSRASQRTR
ncbi:MAG: fibronectin type III domain-containing protein [Planctomycetes bacterium]|nr:fibronectin type III domain-containing protein [Planctomycetota bacterium]